MNSRLHELNRDVHITIKPGGSNPDDLSVPLLNPNDSPTPSRSDSSIYGSGSGRKPASSQRSVGGGAAMDPSDSLLLASFFRDVETVKSHLSVIMDATKRLQHAKEYVSLPAGAGVDHGQQQHQHPQSSSSPDSTIPVLVNETNRRAQRCKLMLMQFRADLAEKPAKGDGGGGSAGESAGGQFAGSDLPPKVTDKTRRIQQNLCHALTRKYVSEMQAYQSAQQGYKNSVTSAAHRQVSIVCPTATSAEVEELCRASREGDEGAVGKVALKALLGARENAPPASAIRNAIHDAEDRYKDVLVLEASLVELSQMFSDFSLMVEEQSELLDNIEFQTRAAKDYLDSGLVDAVEAVRLQKKVRKKQCCIIGVVGSVLAIAVFVVFKPF